MNVIALQSGSSGNCFYVESRGVQLLFDAGITGKQAQQRLALRGREISGADALIISHDHVDHVKYAGIYQRKFGVPLHVTSMTYQVSRTKFNLGPIDTLSYFESGSTLEFNDLTVETIPTAHDGTDGVAFVVDDGQYRLGILTDLGHVFAGLEETVHSLDAVLLESNYDVQMLTNGPYPRHLQDRIRGPGGHLSNSEAAELLRAAAHPRLQWVCLIHLSEQNNSPAVALETHRQVNGDRFVLHVAGRHQVTSVMEL